MRFTDKVVLVTGAGSGIGRAAAQLFAAEGARVGALDWRHDELQACVAGIEESGGQAIALCADVSQTDQVHAAVEKLMAAWGRLDIVFANAGINGVWAPIDEIEPDEWDRTMAVNLRGVFLTFRYTVPYLRRQGGGSMIITSSIQGTRIFMVPGSTAYACTKAAQAAFAKKMAVELARDKIRVNVICPGSTTTRINESATIRSREKIQLPAQFPQGKVLLTGGKKATPEQVAKAVLFLASDDADMITGTELWIDGAQSLFYG
jgi:NAD(P)-dependent dehydrogenase (short-subunit alcohol dehydrogenase family)